jgi:putative NADH-flavin reductase
MRNLETPVQKFALYGAHSSLGSLLLGELLSRQHEVVAVAGDLNSIDVQPGLKAKLGDLFDPLSVSESVAGMDAVVCHFAAPALPVGNADRTAEHSGSLGAALVALEAGMHRVGVRRLLLVAAADSIKPAEEQLLLQSSLDWTLAEPPDIHDRYVLDDFRALADAPPDSEGYRLRRLAAGLVDELEQPLHRRQRIRFQF